MKLIPTMGLEIHAELMTASKIFCGCSAEYGGAPNTRCCPGCAAFPGTLPALNKKAVELIIKAGAITNCEISRQTKWDRKNYFYPDLPKAYQVSQLFKPTCTGGHVDIKTANGDKRIRIKQIHLEEDAGKLIHDQSPKYSLADHNRGGTPLIEIVTEPDFHTAEEVCAFVEKIRAALQYAEICDGKMEQGSLRCDVNISLAPENSPILGVRAEIKNLNSVRSITRAIEFEIDRQTEAIENGEKLYQQTRRFSDENGETYAMRDKENAADYRYFPDPDIPLLEINEEELKAIIATIPEMPEARYERYVTEMELSEHNAKILIGSSTLSNFFEAALKEYNNPKAISSFIVTEVLSFEDFDFSAESAKNIGLLVSHSTTGKISRDTAKAVLRAMIESESGKTPDAICDENNYWIKEDLSLVDSVIDEVIANNPAVVEQYKNGEQKVFGFLMGQCAKSLKGAATPAVIKSALDAKLKE
ncbi:MAG: Asp-tRNA(Asn)/Glu-tRNA(Gln) amidotransferase subunit GatB [Oscillospiraceae bacterium]|nr:Asp-tRNA(Asn)/Glu-tRNA(Gln) amidotransferase subunit GatB [Oscillospiraceae bacterium]